METLASPMERCVWNWIYDAISPQKANFLVFTLLYFVEMVDSFFSWWVIQIPFTLCFSLILCETKEGENVGAV